MAIHSSPGFSFLGRWYLLLLPIGIAILFGIWTCGSGSKGADSGETDSGEADSEDTELAWTEFNLEEGVLENPQNLPDKLKGPNIFAPAFIKIASMRFAHLFGGIQRGLRPVGASLILDVRGQPAAVASVFRATSQVPTKDALLTALTNDTQNLLNAIECISKTKCISKTNRPFFYPDSSAAPHFHQEKNLEDDFCHCS